MHFEQPTRLPQACRVFDLRQDTFDIQQFERSPQYTASAQAVANTPRARETRLRDGFDQLVRPFDLHVPADVVQVLRDDFVTKALNSITKRAGQP